MATAPIIFIDKTNAIVNLGSTYTLTAIPVPVTASSKDITSYAWSSSVPETAIVSETTVSANVINPLAAGSTEITTTATLSDNTTDLSVTTTKLLVINPVTSISLKDSLGAAITGSLIGTVGEDVTLSKAFEPSAPSNQTVYWSSSNTSCATVSDSGVVSCLANGTVTITVTTQDGAKTASCDIIIGTGSLYKPVKSVSITGLLGVPLTPGANTTLTATVLPVDANQTVFWSYPSSSIVTIDASGIVTANAAGTAIVTATTADGAKKATTTITVVNIQTGLYFNTKSISLQVNGTQKITAYPVPIDTSSPATLTWTSSDDTVATVDSTGLVTAVKLGGPVTITASADTTGEPISNTTVVNVVEPPAKVIELDLYSVSPQGYGTMVGNVKTVKVMRDCVFNIPTLIDSTDPAPYKSVQWTATPSNVLLLQPENGPVPSCNVTVLPGVTATTSVVLTVTTNTGNYSDSIKLLVPAVVPTMSVSIDTAKITPIDSFFSHTIHASISEGKVYNVPANIGGGSNVTDTSLVWSVSQPGALVITPNNCSLNPGCSFTVVPDTTVTYCILLAESLYDSGLSAYVPVVITQ